MEKIQTGDFVMVPIITPLGNPAVISETAFRAERNETNGLNFWGPPNSNATIKQTPIEYSNKRKRPIADHILSVLTQHPERYSFKQIKQLLLSAGYKHTPGMIKGNLDILVSEGKLNMIEKCFGIPMET